MKGCKHVMLLSIKDYSVTPPKYYVQCEICKDILQTKSIKHIEIHPSKINEDAE